MADNGNEGATRPPSFLLNDQPGRLLLSIISPYRAGIYSNDWGRIPILGEKCKGGTGVSVSFYEMLRPVWKDLFFRNDLFGHKKFISGNVA